jgi:hypothetical protein
MSIPVKLKLKDLLVGRSYLHTRASSRITIEYIAAHGSEAERGWSHAGDFRCKLSQRIQAQRFVMER